MKFAVNFNITFIERPTMIHSIKRIKFVRIILFALFVLVSSCKGSKSDNCDHAYENLANQINSALLNDINFRYVMFQGETQLSQKSVRVERYSRLIKNLRNFDRSIDKAPSLEDVIGIEKAFLDSVIFLSQVDSSSYYFEKFNDLLQDLNYPFRNVSGLCIRDTTFKEYEKLKTRLIVRRLSDYM